MEIDINRNDLDKRKGNCMITGYKYELWDGKKVIGYHQSFSLYSGKYLVIPELSEFKRPYNRKLKEFKVPIIMRIVSNSGIDVHLRTVLDVRRKSRRQIKILES